MWLWCFYFLLAAFSSVHSRALKHCSATTVGQQQRCTWKVAQKALVCGGTFWQSTAFPLGFALRNSTQVYGASLSLWTSLLYLCMRVCMWKERGKPGISYKDLGADVPSYRTCKGLFPYNGKVFLRRMWALFLAKILPYFQAVSWLEGRALSLSDHSYFTH